MSSESDKIKRSTRQEKTKSKIKQKLNEAKALGVVQEYDKANKQPHRCSKTSLFSCGNPNCVMCANPRKTFNELTLQEKQFIEAERVDSKAEDNLPEEDYPGLSEHISPYKNILS